MVLWPGLLVKQEAPAFSLVRLQKVRIDTCIAPQSGVPDRASRRFVEFAAGSKETKVTSKPSAMSEWTTIQSKVE